MERKHYYAYNKTREAFLSLGVSVPDQAGGSFWSALSKHTLKTNEGIWVAGAKNRYDVNCSGQCDRIYLDSSLRVTAMMEGVMGLPLDAGVEAFDSVLLLPIHTIFGSQTQSGDQVLIGTIEEISAILEGIEPLTNIPTVNEARGEDRTMQSPVKWLAKLFAARDRRRAARHFSPPLMAFYWDGGIPIPHMVTDISRTGLFLRTADRWHPRTLLRVTLQKKSKDPIQPDQTITVQCRVVRTGEEGVGMAFMLAEGYSANGGADIGMLASRKDLSHFLNQLAEDFNSLDGKENPFLPFPETPTPNTEHASDKEDVAIPPANMESNVERNSQAS
jgi:hypothetical protein